MAIKRAQSSVLSGINSNANGFIFPTYNNVSAKYISQATSSITLTGGSSSGTTITVASTTGLLVNHKVTVTAGTGSFATNTVVSSILSSTQFTVNTTPSVALSGATISASTLLYLSSTSWTRPSNVHWIDLLLVGGGGSSAQTRTGGNGFGGFCARGGGGGGGGAVSQINQFYVGDYDLWYIVIAGNSATSSYGSDDCNGDSWGRCGNPTIFSPITSSYLIASLTGTDNSNLRRTLVAPGGGGGGHGCGSTGPIGLGSGGGAGANNGNNYRGIPDTDNGRIGWQAFGSRGVATGNNVWCNGGAGGGGAAAVASGSTGGSGKTVTSPFSGTYGGGGGGGAVASSGGSGGGGANGVAGTNGTGGGGGGGGLTGGTGRIEIRMYYSS